MTQIEHDICIDCAEVKYVSNKLAELAQWYASTGHTASESHIKQIQPKVDKFVEVMQRGSHTHKRADA